MPRTRRKPTVQARLAPDVFKHFSEVAKAKEMTKAALATDAILDYLANYERKKHEEKDRKITEEIDRLSKNYVNATQRSTERICAMLAKIHIDLGVVLELHSELESQEKMKELMSESAKRVGRKVTAAEKEVKDKMSKFIRGDDNT